MISLYKIVMDTKQKKVFNSRPLFYGFLVLLISLVLARNLFCGKIVYIVLACVLILSILAYFLWAKKYVMLLVMLSIFAFGLGWHYVGVWQMSSNVYEESCLVVGRVGDQISTSEWTSRTVLQDVKINGKSEKNINLTVRNYGDNKICEGDIITFEAKISNVKLFELNSFNFSYYRDRAPYEATVNDTNITKLGSKLKADEKFRLYIKNILYKNIGKETGAVAYATLFGDKNEIDGQIKLAYKSSGIVHLLTVSGLHVSFLIALIGFVLKKCRVRGIWNFLCCLVFLGIYSYLCGFSPSIVRAGVMGLVLLTASISGKCYDGLNSIGLAGIIILLFSPFFAFDVGFLMSFFCVLSIYVVAPRLTQIFKKVFPKFVAEGFSISIATSLGIFPFFGKIFSSINFLTFFVNLLVIPIFSILFPTLFVLTLLSACIAPFCVLLKVCGWGFDAISNIAQFFSLTKLQFEVKPLNILLTVLIMLFFYLCSKYFMASKKTRLICLSCILIAFVSTLSTLYFLPPVCSINVCYLNSYATVMITNSQRKTLVIDSVNYQDNQRLYDSNFVKRAGTLVLVNAQNVTDDKLLECDFDNVYVLSGQQSCDGEILVEKDEIVSFDGFDFCYKYSQTKFVGLEVKFDGVKLIVLSEKATDAQLEEVSQNDYDFMVTYKNDDYVSYFAEKSAKIITYYKTQWSSYNYAQDGNISLKLPNFKRRYID